MPARWKAGLALLALSIAGPAGAEPLTAQDVIARCASQADARLTGISALNSACPGVDKALGQLGLTAFLPPSWPKTLTAGGLADLGALTRRYAGSAVFEPPRAATLRSIAAGLVPPLPPPTWSDRIGAWIQHWTGPLLQPLGRWLQSFGPGAARSRLAQTVFYGLTALLLAAVAVLLTLELRGAGFIRPRRQAARPHSRPIAAGFREPVETESGEPNWARLREQPARVLRLLVDALTRSHRLGRYRHLTCRELETEARFDTEIEREGFARVARLAERELYGPPGTHLLSEGTLRDVKALHARLLAAAKHGDNRQ